MQPIVLAHGFLGYRRFLVWELFKGVKEALEEESIPAFQPLVHPTDSIANRAWQLQQAIDHEIGPSEPIHIVAHSMGGLDARYLASPHGLNQGHRIVSITTVSTPHQGSCLAEYLTRPYCTMISYAAWLGHLCLRNPENKKFLGEVADKTWDAIIQLTPHYVQNVFNPQVIDHPHVHYFSYGGIRQKTGKMIIDMARGGPQLIISPREGDNDGMVSIESAKWGIFNGVIFADHGEQIGLQITPWIPNRFDHIAFFREIAHDLQKLEEGIYSPMAS